MNGLAISIIHPSFENLKNKGRFFHGMAGIVIGLNAFHQFRQPQVNLPYFWCQLVISLDILAVVICNREFAHDFPRLNSVFRLIEILVFTAAACIFLRWGNRFMFGFLALAVCGYSYLLYCEQRIHHEELIRINPSGISISGFPQHEFFLWSSINNIHIHSGSISIRTADGRNLHFPLRGNLQFEELDQIHEFCRHYLKE